MLNFLKKIKVRFNFLLDRGYEFCNDVLRGVYAIPDAWMLLLRPLAAFFAHLFLLGTHFPRISSYKLSSPDWSILFLGSEQGLKEIAQLFTKGECSIEPQERVALWSQARFARNKLQTEADLVIVEHLSFLSGFKSEIAFTTPQWIDMRLDIPQDLSQLVYGDHCRGIRLRINRGEKAGYKIRVSHAMEDLEFFYNRMYLPFIQYRHQHLSLVSTLEYFRKALKKGGLLLVTHQDQPLAGTVFEYNAKECSAVEAGVMDGDPVLWQQGINVNLTWGLIQWAHEKKIPVLDMGNSHSWTSNGSYKMKADWQARAAATARIFPAWTFLARSLNKEQTDRINRIGFVTKHKGKYFRLVIADPGEALEVEIEKVKREGLSGIAVLKAGQPVRYVVSNLIMMITKWLIVVYAQEIFDLADSVQFFMTSCG